jgi:hypothetical protein
MPWTGYFHKMASADLFIFLDDVQFKKNEWQHRNRIRNAQGFQWLSVPNFYTFGQRINEVRINNEKPWQRKHLNSLRMCYAKTPWFSEYADLFQKFYERTWETMDTVTIDSVRMLAEIMNVTTDTDVSSRYQIGSSATQRLVDICRHVGATHYLAGAGGKDYMDLSLFETQNITVEFQEFHPPCYPQRWSRGDDDFIPGLSALDLIFNCGPESYSIIMEQK